MKKSLFIGYDPREHDAMLVCKKSLAAHSRAIRTGEIEVNTISLNLLRARGLYWRTHLNHAERGKPPLLWDVISQAQMSTEFAISRFLTPSLAGSGIAMFMDCDFMARADISELFDMFDPSCAVQVVKHQVGIGTATKMDGQVQTAYPRKNWSSLMMFNVDHPANQRLDIHRVNNDTGRDLHSFNWLMGVDELIGGLDSKWNHLVGIDPPRRDASLVHFTLGIPTMDGYQDCEYSTEWMEWMRK